MLPARTAILDEYSAKVVPKDQWRDNGRKGVLWRGLWNSERKRGLVVHY